MITCEQLVAHYPIFYHMAEANSWESIKARGLLSTTALLDLFEVKGTHRNEIESCHRPRKIILSHPKYGQAVIRDQIPMRESSLKKCLIGITPRQWYECLNGRVFMWATRERVETLLGAKAYRSDKHLVLTIDSRTLLDAHARTATLSPINSGSTIYKPVMRGLSTFQPFSSYPFEERRKARGISNAVAEIAFDYAIPDLRRFVLKAEIRKHGERPQVLFKKH